jgi:SpoIID/LytB domain protein
MDDYVRGVIAAEMPASWHQQALRSQAVAARTYASSMQQAADGRYYQVCDTTSCQVYGGVEAQTPTTNKAVKATAGKILVDGGRAAFTQFSASSGGWTSDGGYSYLPAQRDPWDDWPGNSNSDWSTTIRVASLESAYRQLGQLQAIRVTRRDGNGDWGGRVLRLVLDGSDGSVAITGDDFRWHYGLRSNWFSFAATPIISMWRRLGGPTSLLGRPITAETVVKGRRGAIGTKQVFTKGADGHPRRAQGAPRQRHDLRLAQGRLWRARQGAAGVQAPQVRRRAARLPGEQRRRHPDQAAGQLPGRRGRVQQAAQAHPGELALTQLSRSRRPGRHPRSGECGR